MMSRCRTSICKQADALRTRLRFERLPAAAMHPKRIDALLPDRLQPALRQRLITSARLRPRLAALLGRRLALPACLPADLETQAGRLAMLEGDDLDDAVRLIGAVWHGRAIAGIVVAAPLRMLIDQLGLESYRAVLALSSAVPEETPDDAGSDIDRLMAAIHRDGLIAIGAWCRHRPATLARRLRLKLPPLPEIDDEPGAPHRDLAPAIVDRVAAALFASKPEADDHG